MKHYRPEDIISISFSLVISTFQFYYFIIEGFLSFKDVIILPIFLLLLFVIIILDSRKKSFALKFIRSYYHIPYYAVVFSSFQTFVHRLNPYDWDKLLLEWDYTLVGFDATIWFEQFVTPWLTEILTIAYFSYYIIPTMTFIILYYSARTHQTATKYLLAIVTAWYISFIFYSLMPAAGPDIVFPGNYSTTLMGVSPFTNYYLEKLSLYLRESQIRNTFPSMHFGIILISSYFAYRYSRRYFWLCLLPLGSLLGIATIYLRQHYVVDLIASFPLASFSIYAGLNRKILSEN